MIITNNKVVSINYVLKDELGNLLQGNDGFTPEEYLHGADNILPGLERALEGLKQDQVIDVVIYPEEAYGPKEVSLIIEVANEDLEDPAAVSEGEYIALLMERKPLWWRKMMTISLLMPIIHWQDKHCIIPLRFLA